MKNCILGFLFLLSSQAFSQGLPTGTSNFSNPNDTKGLCTSDNKEESYYGEGICQSLKEQLTEDKCTAPLLEKLRKKLVDQYDGKAAADAKDKGFTLNQLSCESRDGVSQYEKIIKNKQVFGTIMMQFFMSVAVAESNLDEFNGLDRSPGQNKNASAKGGLMNLTLSQMDEAKYNQGGCGCHVTNSSEQTAWFWALFFGEQAYAANFLQGNSPGPRDAHHSIQCGTYMALYEAAQDGELFTGMQKGKGSNGNNDNKPKGAAKIFQSLQEIEGELKNKDDLAVNPKLNLILKKMKSYCRRNMNPNGTLIHTMDDDFPGGGTAIRDNTGT